MSNTPTQEPQYRAVTAYTIPLPPHVGEESHGPSQSPVKLYDADQMHAHAAAVSAAKDAEIAQLRADATDRQNNVVMPLRERVRELTTQAMFNARLSGL